ncbi:MAG: glycosyltransferase family 4 protein [Patescibacteria group bacterium]|nr:glycosyltransferase family 4 protein [Patescibacteria group bacterium]
MKKKLRIGFFTDTYKPQVNGVVSSIDNFRKELEGQGHEVIVFCPRVKGEKDTTEVKRFPSFKFIFQPEYRVSLPVTMDLEKTIGQELDIIHAHTPFGLGLLGYYYAVKKHKPFIYTFHTLYPEYVKTYFLKGRVVTPKMVEKLSSFFSNHCDLTLAPSSKIKKLLLSYGVIKPVAILPTGVAIDEFEEPDGLKEFSGKYNLGKDEKILVYVGRLGKEKNIEFLIRTAAELKKKINNVKLLLVGDGPGKESLKNLVKKLGLGNTVIFTGYLPRAEVNKAYHASDIFVFASQTETQGMVLLEAAACGLPIVAVKDLAFGEVLKNGVNGFACEKNSAVFAGKILLLLKNKKLYRAMSVSALKRARLLSSKNQTKRLLRLYKSTSEK